MQQEFTTTNAEQESAITEAGFIQRLAASFRMPTLSEAAVGVAVLIAGIAVFTALTSDADLPATS
jgi:hypothetical protein